MHPNERGAHLLMSVYFVFIFFKLHVVLFNTASGPGALKYTIIFRTISSFSALKLLVGLFDL